jgi:hypothetical protein
MKKKRADIYPDLQWCMNPLVIHEVKGAKYDLSFYYTHLFQPMSFKKKK